MRLKRIAAICAKLKRIILCNVHSDNQQWIGDGIALYPACELPPLDSVSVFSVFDIPPETREKRWTQVAEESQYPFSFRDDDPSDKPLDEFGVSVEFGGVAFKPFKTEDGAPLFIDASYLKPIAHLLDETAFYERDAGGGKSVVVAKTGMMVSAIIMPRDPTKDEGFIEELPGLAETCRAKGRTRRT